MGVCILLIIKYSRTENPLSLCQVDSNGKITVFLSFSDHPTIRCVAFGRWTEWFKYFYEYVHNIH